MDERATEAGGHSREFGASAGWSARYAAGHTPWDQGGPHPELARRLAAGELEPWGGGRALVGGAGRGHDALALARAGWDVTAVDFAAGLAAAVGPELEALGSRFVEGDALAFDAPPFELLFEHTFFCALPPERRADWGAMAERLTAPAGRLVALVFPADKPRAEGGPPHRTTVDDLAAALGPAFRRTRDEALERPSPTRAWAERWAEFERLKP